MRSIRIVFRTDQDKTTAFTTPNFTTGLSKYATRDLISDIIATNALPNKYGAIVGFDKYQIIETSKKTFELA